MKQNEALGFRFNIAYFQKLSYNLSYLNLPNYKSRALLDARNFFNPI